MERDSFEKRNWLLVSLSLEVNDFNVPENTRNEATAHPQDNACDGPFIVKSLHHLRIEKKAINPGE